MFDFDFDKIANSKMWGDGMELARVAIAANGRQPVGGMQLIPPIKTAAGSVEYAGRATSEVGNNPMADALAPLAAAFGAKYTNRELNRNPPYWLYGMVGLGLVGLYLVVKK